MDSASDQRRPRKCTAHVATAAAISLAALTACNGGSAGSGMDGETVIMHTWVGGDADREQWGAYVEAGNQADSSVDVSFSGPAIGNYYTALPTVLQGSNAPCIVTLQNGQVSPYIEGLEPLEDLAADVGLDLNEYNEAMLEQLSVDGEVYAIPYGAEPNLIFYNRGMFEEAGVPEPTLGWTTEEFLEAAEALTGDGQYGYAIGPGLFHPTYWMAANGEADWVQDGVGDLTDENLIERIQFKIDLATEHEVARPLEADAGGTFPHIDAFSNGQAAMMMNGTWDLQHQQDQIGEENLGITSIPSDDGVARGAIAGTGFAVTQNCSDQEAAMNAIAAMTSLEAQEEVGRTRGNVPSREAALEAWGADEAEEIVEVVREVTTNGVASEIPHNINELNTGFSQYIVEAYAGRSSVEDVLQLIAADDDQS
ncbi:ABC transporter substrate-binding protein [Bogoriella caseilytica]|uniref:Carbohydrate ABC transporter substrate-binding protein (CUT1 family) n=1 Tax=Bogoriella caseilytica TaxID=56055 RepID=A0A3N2BAH7_9MICO|nr:sugar ABC transporter substrate-binding protein [Bogoriella caseilytica]ROR72255.1 carbohydrate ABC transporter substrate-binding protein (CUT1 family) [Bogoriella caseilytica]